MSADKKPVRHVIYGLYIKGKPRAIRYIGSSRADKINKRLREHQNGQVRTTKKAATKEDIPLTFIRMTIIREWWSGNEPSPEGTVTRTFKSLGLADWNSFLWCGSEASHRGGLKSGRTARDLKTGIFAIRPERRRQISRAAGLKAKSLGLGIFALNHEERVRASRMGGHVGGLKCKELRLGAFAPENKGKGGRASAGKGARKCRTLRIGIFAPENRGMGGRIGGRRTKDLAKGIFDPVIHSRNSRQRGLRCKREGLAIFAPEYDKGKGGRTTKLRRVGIFARSAEEMIEAGRRCGRMSKELKIGIFAITPERRKEIAQKCGRRVAELKIGICGRSPEKMREDGQKGGRPADG